MKTRSILISLVIAMAIPTYGNATSDPCSEPSTSNICGTTVISGTGPGVVAATLSNPATLTLATGSAPNVGDGKAIEIEGGTGPFVGFAIAADVPDRNGLGLVFTRIPSEIAYFDAPYLWSGFGETLGPRPQQISLPAGDYRLYVLTDGDAGTTVTLRFSGLTGTSNLSASTETHYESLRLNARIIETEAVPVHSVGASRELPRIGVGFAVFPLDTSIHTVSAHGHCFSEFPEDSPITDEIAFLPPCPVLTSSRLVATAITSPGAYKQRVDVLAGVLTPGRYGFGYFYAGATLIDSRVPSYEAWLALD